MHYSDKMQTNLGGGGGNIYHSQTMFYKRNEHFKRFCSIESPLCIIFRKKRVIKYGGGLSFSITLAITVQTTYILLDIEQTEMKLSNEKIEVFFQFAYFLVNVATTYHQLLLVCFLAFYLK